jgi:hypothetical protein
MGGKAKRTKVSTAPAYGVDITNDGIKTHTTKATPASVGSIPLTMSEKKRRREREVSPFIN